MLHNFTALHDVQEESWETIDLQIPNRKYIIIKRRHLKDNKDAEANDMILMGSDHRCVMATFMITTPKTDGHREMKDKLETTKHDRSDQAEKNTGDEKLELEKQIPRDH